MNSLGGELTSIKGFEEVKGDNRYTSARTLTKQTRHTRGLGEKGSKFYPEPNVGGGGSSVIKKGQVKKGCNKGKRKEKKTTKIPRDSKRIGKGNFFGKKKSPLGLNLTLTPFKRMKKG